MSSRKWTVVLLSVAALVALGLGGCPGPTTVTGDVEAGATLFAARCASCHSAAAVAPGRALVTTDLGTIAAAMQGIFLTDQEVADTKAFLDTQEP